MPDFLAVEELDTLAKTKAKSHPEMRCDVLVIGAGPTGLACAIEAQKAEADNLNPRFKIPPAPVTSPGAHGEVTLEASVNQDGEVTDVRQLVNTTGNPELASRNIHSLHLARFEPIIQHGTRQPFTYEYRVHY